MERSGLGRRRRINLFLGFGKESQSWAIFEYGLTDHGWAEQSVLSG